MYLQLPFFGTKSNRFQISKYEERCQRRTMAMTQDGLPINLKYTKQFHWFFVLSLF